MITRQYEINLRGKIFKIDKPLIMGILNCTPDSFYSQSRVVEQKDMAQRITQMISEGADWIDIGGYSSRPGAIDISEKEEIERIKPALEIMLSDFPEIPVSIDTFRAKVAKYVIENFNIDIINDISAGQLEPKILNIAAESNKIYIGMHMMGNPQNMQTKTIYNDLLKDIKIYFAKFIDKATRLGINDLILDPGFGFAKTLDQNYEILNKFYELSIFNKPLLAGLSRKSMIYKYLNTRPEESITGTIALNTIALMNGVSILRAHDVTQARETVELVQKTINNAI